MTISLSVGGYSLTISTFGSNFGSTYPRSRVNNWPAINYSVHGSAILEGPTYEPKFQWNFTARLNSDDRITLRRMLGFWLANRATAWTLEDFTEELVEASPGTRAIATGATESDDTTTTAYHAKYYVFPSQYPELSEYSGAEELITLQFTEGAKFAR